MTRFFAFAIFILGFASCRPATHTPKPRGYYRVSLPQHIYRPFAQQGFPYRFEYPGYGKIIQDTSFFGHKPENPYWINIDFPTIGGRFYISYKVISTAQPLSKLLEDAYEMSYKAHDKRADYIEPRQYSKPEDKVYGMLYAVGGNAASAYQFFATDSVRHFLRGALYFDVSPNVDSLRPANEFLRDDMIHLMETLQWNN